MKKSVRSIFLGVTKDKFIEICNNQEKDFQTLCNFIEAQRKYWEIKSDIKNLKAYLKKQDAQQKHPPKYIKLEKRLEILQHIYSNSHFEIEFFCTKNQESYRKIIRNIDLNLNQIQRCLSTLTNQLKDQVNQFNAPNIIRRNTSKDYQVVQVFLVVCDPLVEQDHYNKQIYYPLYHDQIDISSHVQRLKKASLSNSDLTIKVSRIFGTLPELDRVLNGTSSSQHQKPLFSIVQIFTRIQKRDGIIYMSLQSSTEEGVCEWYPASQILTSQVSASIIIVIGVGAYQLLQIDQTSANTRLICITTISLEDKRILANVDQRNPTESQNCFNDHSSQLFIEEFYSHLFKRNKIQQCYEHAYNFFKAQASSIIWCCCLHPHHQSCPWYSLIKKVGQPQAHRLFKHGVMFWKKLQNIEHSFKLQLLLSGKKQKQRIDWKQGCCPQTTTCCWQKMGVQKIQMMHSNLPKVIVSNQKQLDEQFYANIQARFQRPNRFQSQSYEKPIGIRPPLTIFLAAKHINKHSFCILQSQGISHGKKLFMYVKEYIQVRKSGVQFFEIKVGISPGNNERTELQKQINRLKQKNPQPMGASSKSRIQKIYLWAVHSGQKSQHKYYQKLLQEFWYMVSKQASLKIQLKLILLIDKKAQKQFQRQNPVVSNPLNLSKKITITQICHYLTDNLPAQQYHNVLSRHSYKYILDNLFVLQSLILDGVPQINKQSQIFNIQPQYQEFLGFLAQFGDQGFHLTKVTRVIVKELFDFQSNDFIDQAIARSQGLEHIQVADYTYLQLTKRCQEHFNSLLPGQRLKYIEKKLQFYYILMRLYFQLWPLTQAVHYPTQIRNYINKKGIFSIDISLQSAKYEESSKICLQEISQDKQIIKYLFDTSSTIHIYHLHQIQRMLDQIVKKKKNRHNPSSRSFINQKSFQTFQYLLWNIIHRSWLMAQVLYKTYPENVDSFKTKLLQFIEKTQINLPISGIAAIQLSILMGQNPPALKDNDFGVLTNFIGKYRHFAYKQRLLQTLQPKWGHLQQFKTFYGNCCHLALQIGTLMDETKKNPDPSTKNTNEIDQIRYKQKMFKSSNGTVWRLQCLKLIQRKLLFYYAFTSDLKKNQSLTEFNQKSTQIENYFKLREIVYEYNTIKHSVLTEVQLDKNSQLIQLYLSLILKANKVGESEGQSKSQNEAQQKKLLELQSKISPQYMPVFNYLYQQYEQKALFNQKDLIIFARARNIINDGKPYVYIRKRTLLTEYLCKVLQKRALKVSYFSLTNQTLNIFQRSQNNNCEVLCMILTVDTTDQGLIMFGNEEGVQTAPITIQALADKLKKCRIKVLILCGKNSKKVCQTLKGCSQIGTGMQCSAMISSSIQNSSYLVSTSMIKQKNMQASTIGKSKINASTKQINQSTYNFPTIIAIQNNKYSLQDAQLFQYQLPQKGQKSESIPQNRQSIFNRQPSNVQVTLENQNIEIQQVNFGHKNILDFLENQEEEQINILDEKYQKMKSMDTGRVSLGQVTMKKAYSISEQVVEQKVLGIQKYISNEINQIAMDLIVISLVKNITNQLKNSSKLFTQHQLDDILMRSRQMVKAILYNKFEYVDEVFSNIQTSIWSNKHTLSQINQGNYEELTKKFYCVDSNLLDQNYYQNVGYCKQLSQVIKHLNSNMNCIEILGGNLITKSNLLQEVCWVSQSKSFFKFGIIKLDFKHKHLSHHIANKEFIDRQKNNTRTGVLIAIDNVELLNQHHRSQLKNLRGKQFTLLYTTLSPIKGQELRQILDFKEYQCIDLDKRNHQELNKEIYATLLCNIKQKNQPRFNHEKLEVFQNKVQEIMQIVQKQKCPNRLTKALELLRGTGRTEEERTNSFLHFYRQHYQELYNILLQKREITIKFKSPNE